MGIIKKNKLQKNDYQMKEEEMLINISMLSRELNLSKSFIYQAVGRKEIPYLKIGRSVRFNIDAIRKWLEEKTINLNSQQLT